MNDISRLAINQATTKLQWNLRQAVEGYARHGVRRIGIWRDRLEECGLSEAKQLLRDHGMTVTGLNRAGPLLGLATEFKPSTPDDDRRAIEEAAEIQAECLLVFPGVDPTVKDPVRSRGMMLERLAALLPDARKAQVELAIEPLHPMFAADRSALNTMEQANRMCDALGEGAGIVLDVYHCWWDPDLENQIQRAGARRILGFHVCDWLVPTREMMQDRGMMGDGVIDIPSIRKCLEQAGYAGAVEVEIFSARDWWIRDPDEVVRIAIERYLSRV